MGNTTGSGVSSSGCSKETLPMPRRSCRKGAWTPQSMQSMSSFVSKVLNTPKENASHEVGQLLGGSLGPPWQRRGGLLEPREPREPGPSPLRWKADAAHAWLGGTHPGRGLCDSVTPAAHLSSCHERSGSPWEVEPRIVRYCSSGSPGPQRGLFWEGMRSLQRPDNGGWSVG